VRWEGDSAAFERWCVEARDLTQFREAIASVPEADRPLVFTHVRDLLAQPGPGEPESDQLRRDTPLADRMRSPLAILLRQVRLEKLRLLGPRRVVVYDYDPDRGAHRPGGGTADRAQPRDDPALDP
jgi:hypothetical protein